MCRNIRVLHNFKPPSTPDEIRAAALQYVRKVSGTTRVPSKADTEAFEAAVDAITEATAKLLAALPVKGTPRTREGELVKARAKWAARAQRIQNAR